MANFTANDIDYTFFIDNDTKTAHYVDNVDYSTFNTSQATIKGLGTATYVDDIYISKLTAADPLINISVGDDTSADYDEPLDTEGEIANGARDVLYRVYMLFAATNQDVFSISNGAGGPTIIFNSLDLGWMVAGDQFAVTGSAQAGNNKTYTVVSVTVAAGNSTIIVSESVTNDSPSLGVAAYSIAHTYDKEDTYDFSGCNFVTPEMEMDADCDLGTMGSFTASDTTEYTVDDIEHTVTNHVMNVYPPHIVPEPSADPYTSALYAFTVAELITNAQYTGELLGDVTYTQDDGLVVTYSLANLPERSDGTAANAFAWDIDCGGTLCGLMDCINAFWSDYKGCATPSQTQQLKATRISYGVVGYQESKACGNTDQMAIYLADLESVLGGDCSCADESDVPKWVNNSSESLTTIILEMQAQITALEAALVVVVPVAHLVPTMLGTAEWAQSPFTNMFLDQRFLLDIYGYVELNFIVYNRDAAPRTFTIEDSLGVLSNDITLAATTRYHIHMLIGWNLFADELAAKYTLTPDAGTTTAVVTSLSTFPTLTDMTLTISTDDEDDVAIYSGEVVAYKMTPSTS